MSEAPHERIRVLVVDDSVAVRRLLTGILSSDPGIEVVGTACDGRAALAAIETLRPDVMTLDVEMPILDGLSTLRELRKRWRSLPVIMLSTLTVRGAESTLDALTSGANDYVPKPTQMSDRGAAIEGVKTLLLPKVKALYAKYAAATRAQAAGAPAFTSPATPVRPAAPSAVLPFPAPSRGSLAEIVAIGVSTGGPNALAVVLPGLPADLGVPIVIAQHIPPVFSGVLAQRLNNASKIRVVEAKGGEVPEAGFAYIAPGGQHLVMGGTRTAPRLALSEAPPENSCRPSVDVLFRSVAAVYGRSVLGVMLTGMGQDGVEGSRTMRQAGASVIVQDEATSVVWGMPGLVWKAGLAEGMFPLEEISGEVAARVARSRRPRAISGG